MAEYIIKQKVTDRMGCCLANAKAEYKAAKDEFTKARFGDYISAIQAMIDVVECSEAADVQPTKRGRWEYYKNNGIFDTHKCTLCGEKYEIYMDIEPTTIYKYCPNCGARMNGDETIKG